MRSRLVYRHMDRGTTATLRPLSDTTYAPLAWMPSGKLICVVVPMAALNAACQVVAINLHDSNRVELISPMLDLRDVYEVSPDARYCLAERTSAGETGLYVYDLQEPHGVWRLPGRGERARIFLFYETPDA